MNTKEEMLAIYKAREEGNVIQKYIYNDNTWIDIEKDTKLEFDKYLFRVKPDKELVPYNSIVEFLNDQKINGPYFIDKGNSYYLPSSIIKNNGEIYFKGEGYIINAESLLEEYTWQNGTVCGKLK